jgi:hypothetical protein
VLALSHSYVDPKLFQRHPFPLRVEYASLMRPRLAPRLKSQDAAPSGGATGKEAWREKRVSGRLMPTSAALLPQSWTTAHASIIRASVAIA